MTFSILSALSEPVEIVVSVIAVAVIGILFALLIALFTKFFSVKEDPRKEKVMSLIPGANCGACGHPGCSGLVDALLSGEEKHVKQCKVIKQDKAEEIKEYLNSTPDLEGNTLKVDL